MESVTETGLGTGVAASTTPVELRFTPASLDLRNEIVLDAGRRRVFDALLHISAWWPHRVRAGTGLVLEPRVGGRFFENCDDGCGILLGHLSRLVMPELFAMEGSFGIETPVVGVWSVRLDAEGNHRTLVHGRLAAFGAMEAETRAGAAARWQATYAALTHYLDA
jgi:hypothetical protein